MASKGFSAIIPQLGFCDVRLGFWVCRLEGFAVVADVGIWC